MNGVKIVRSNILMMEGVIHTIAGLLRPVVNFCDKKTQKTVFVSTGLEAGNPSDTKETMPSTHENTYGSPFH